MFVKPGINPETGKPFVVRIPRTFAALAAEGEEVPANGFWIQRLAQGDVVSATAPAAANTESTMTIEQEAADLQRRIAAEPASQH
jgi:hypothetical protein